MFYLGMTAYKPQLGPLFYDTREKTLSQEGHASKDLNLFTQERAGDLSPHC